MRTGEGEVIRRSRDSRGSPQPAGGNIRRTEKFTRSGRLKIREGHDGDAGLLSRRAQNWSARRARLVDEQFEKLEVRERGGFGLRAAPRQNGQAFAGPDVEKPPQPRSMGRPRSLLQSVHGLALEPDEAVLHPI